MIDASQMTDLEFRQFTASGFTEVPASFTARMTPQPAASGEPVPGEPAPVDAAGFSDLDWVKYKIEKGLP